MERNREAVEPEVRSQKPEARIAVCGHTDLALVTRHLVSQRHLPRNFPAIPSAGTSAPCFFMEHFCLNFDLPLINEVLRMPSKQPDYRNDRSHTDFLINLTVPAARLKTALGQGLECRRGITRFPRSGDAPAGGGKVFNRRNGISNPRPCHLNRLRSQAREVTSSLTKCHLKRRLRTNAGR